MKVYPSVQDGVQYSTLISGTPLLQLTPTEHGAPKKLDGTVSTNTRGFWSPNGQKLCLNMCVIEGCCLDAYPQSPNLATRLFCPQVRLQCWLY